MQQKIIDLYFNDIDKNVFNTKLMASLLTETFSARLIWGAFQKFATNVVIVCDKCVSSPNLSVALSLSIKVVICLVCQDSQFWQKSFYIIRAQKMTERERFDSYVE